jgi:hypothetical protein
MLLREVVTLLFLKLMKNVSTFCGKYSLEASSHKYRKVSIGFVMSVRPSPYIRLSACISAAPGGIFMKYDGRFVRISFKKIKIFLKFCRTVGSYT